MAKFRNHTSFPKQPKNALVFRFPHVCISCRKSYKYPPLQSGRICPQCGKAMVMLGRKFSAPKSRDVEQWRKIQFLIEHGYRFHRLYIWHGSVGVQQKYPATLQEAKEMVLRLGDCQN